MSTIRLALDWTPNANHVGFFVAQKKGFYQQAGLTVEIQNPADDNYSVTPAKRVELGRADLALCPTESLLSYRAKTVPVPLLGIAALHRQDLSAIVVLEDTGITTPRELDGKIYASYRARYEDGIVRAMVRSDGGRGELEISYPDKLGIWDRLINGKADATWVFVNWEGVVADASDKSFRYFRLADFGIPYGYSPVIAGHADHLAENPERFRSFLSATKRGYLYTQRNTAEATKILQAHLPVQDLEINLTEALQRTLPYCGTADTWGTFEAEATQDFLDWIHNQGLEERKFTADEIVTNTLLE